MRAVALRRLNRPPVAGYDLGMVAKALLDNVLALPTEDRLALVEQVWASLREDPNAVPLTDAQRAELDRRVADMKSAPDEESDWADVQARLLSTRRETTK